MSILTSIVNILSDETKPLSAALLKLKVLAHRLQNKEFSVWVEKEVNGYPNNSLLPNYRRHRNILKCNYQLGGSYVEEHIVPLSVFPANIKDKIRYVCFFQSIYALEFLSQQTDYRIEAPRKAAYYIQDYYEKQGNDCFVVGSIWSEVSITAIPDLLSSVRNLALDLVLKLEEDFGYEIDITEILKEKDKANTIINNIMNQNNIINSGDGNLFNAGDWNTINQTVNIQKRDFNQLKKALLDSGIEVEDISELKEVIDNDSPIAQEKKFGPKVNQWIQKMIAKALDGTWQISLATAGNFLAKLLENYYGM